MVKERNASGVNGGRSKERKSTRDNAVSCAAGWCRNECEKIVTRTSIRAVSGCSLWEYGDKDIVIASWLYCDLLYLVV